MSLTHRDGLKASSPCRVTGGLPDVSERLDENDEPVEG